MAIRVAIFEDNPVMRDAYQAILNGVEGFLCTGAFTNCNDLKHDIEKSNPDVVLMDIEMYGLCIIVKLTDQLAETIILCIDRPNDIT